MPRTYKPKKDARAPIPEAAITEHLINTLIDQALQGSNLITPSNSDKLALASLIRNIHSHFIYDSDKASEAAFRLEKLTSLSASLGEPIPREAFTTRWRTLAPIIGGAFSKIMVLAGNADPHNGLKGAKVGFLVSLVPHLTGQQPDANSMHQCLQSTIEVPPPGDWPRTKSAGRSPAG
jgi:hypothetical protein